MEISVKTGGEEGDVRVCRIGSRSPKSWNFELPRYFVNNLMGLLHGENVTDKNLVYTLETRIFWCVVFSLSAISPWAYSQNSTVTQHPN